MSNNTEAPTGNDANAPTSSETNDKNETADASHGRAKIIDVVRTPLGFFVLVTLVIEALFIVLIYAANVNSDLQTGLLITAFALIFFLIIIVTLMAIFKPESLSANRQITVIPSPQPVRSNSKAEIIKPEGILCTSSPQWKDLSFEMDVKEIKKSFRKVTVEYQLNSDKFSNLLTDRNFSIIHIVTYIDRNNGDTIFSEIRDGKPLSPIDKINVSGFSSLIENNNIRLVVLATCDSLLLAVLLSRITNVISTNGWVEGKDIAKWSGVFYRSLSKGRTLSKAYEEATNITNVPMLLIIKRDFSLEKS